MAWNWGLASRTIILAFGVCLLIWLAQLPARTSDVPSANKPVYDQPLSPLEEHTRTCRVILTRLVREHYQQISIDNGLSNKVFESYLSELDPGRSYFLASDIDEFEPYRDRLDDLFASGDLEPAFMIFNRYKRRATERLQFLLARLDEGLNDMSFDVTESVDIDREEAPWPIDINELIEQGPIVQVRAADGSISILRDPDDSIYYRGPLALLTNRLSASASEICAAAIQDYGRGIVIGEPTFGKGTVQSLLKLNRGRLKATVAKFYRISGESTQYKGTNPDLSYPSLHNREKIGESTLSNALPWDTITRATYESFSNLSPLMDTLRTRHQCRLQDDPDFKYLLALSEHLDEVRSETAISLNEAVRRQERDETTQWRLDLENSLRRDKSQDPITELSELKSDTMSTAHDNEDERPQEDPVLIEAAHILLDYVELSAPRVAQP